MDDKRWIGAALAALALMVGRADAVDAQVAEDTTPPVLDVGLSSPVVSPNGDDRLDRVTIRVTVDEPAAITVRLQNAAGTGSRVLADELTVGAGTTSFVWNGRLRRPNGSWFRAPDGRVDVDVTAVDPSTNASSAHDRVTVDTVAPSVHLADITPEPWTGRGTLTERFVTRDGSRPLTMWSQVLDGDHLVDEMVHRPRPADTRDLTWLPEDGRAPLPPGPYRAVVVVRDAAGNTGRSSAEPFRVHRRVTTQVVNDVAGAGPRIGLTIDDCADHDAWASELDTLERLHAGATFFCNGNNVRRWPDLARRTATTPRISIGSHSTDHADLTTVGYAGAYFRILGDESAWWDVARTTPVPWFRPPYGAYDSSTLAAAGDAGFPYTVTWSIDPQDWQASDAASIVHRSVDKAKSGLIILIHVKPLTAQALPAIISGLRARGLEPVGLPELTGR